MSIQSKSLGLVALKDLTKTKTDSDSYIIH